MRWSWLVWVTLLAGCFVDRSGTVGPPDGEALRRDAGSPIDPIDGALSPEAGSGCTAADQRCDGEVALLCADGRLRAVDCAGSNAWCDEMSGEPRCVSRICVPSDVSCSSDGSSVTTCDARGSSFSEERCPRGCADGACRPETPCSLAVLHTLGDGAETLRVDLCGNVDDTDYAKVDGDGCPNGSEANSEDVVLRLPVARAGRYRIDVVDVDADRIVDPAVYVWSDCASPASQVGCDDQGGEAADDARLEVDLTPGDWFVMVDAYDYNPVGLNNTRTCGEVEVRVTPL